MPHLRNRSACHRLETAPASVLMAMYSHHPPDIQPATMIPTVYSPYTPNYHEYQEHDDEGLGIDLTQLPLNLLVLIISYVRLLALSVVGRFAVPSCFDLCSLFGVLG